jgi:hypothetical protein
MAETRMVHDHLASLLGALCGYGAYRANAVGWWLALIAWIPAGVFALTAFVALVNRRTPTRKQRVRPERPLVRRSSAGAKSLAM